MRTAGLAVLALAVLLTKSARAEPPRELSLAAGGGLQALTVSVFPQGRLVRFETPGARGELAIDLPPEGGTGAVLVESVAIGGGKRVAHVRVASTARPDVAWEAIVAGRAPAVVWSGVTGYARGESGELAGEALDLTPTGEGADERTVIVGEVREDLRICGQARTVLSPRVLDAATMTLRGATMQRLDAEEREKAERLVASPHGGPADVPLARLLVATGASTALGAPAALTDGDPATTWSEGRPGDGHGEFVVMRAPADVPVARLAITVAPPSPSAHGAAPRTFYLVADHRMLAVTLPEDAWRHPGAAYDIPLAEPLRASCLALVLDKAYERPGEAHPEVTVAELAAYSAFDAPGATLEQAARALGGGGPRGEAAKGVLERAGDRGLAAVAAAYPSLDEPGRALAIDAAIGAGTCEATAPLLLAAMSDRDREVARKGREKLERCGKRAAPALLSTIRTADERDRANAASLLAAVAPREALDALVDLLASGGPGTRAALRAAVAKAARGAATEKLASLVAAPRAPEARVDLLRALQDEAARVLAPCEAAAEALLAPDAPMRTRYLLAEPLAALARAGDAGAAARLASLVARDPDAAVRAHAAESATGFAAAKGALVGAASDDAPRVREAALRSLATVTPPLPVDVVAKRLASDEWTFVRSAAASALAGYSPDPRVDAGLEAALGDAAATVREAVIFALAQHRDAHAAPGIRARLDDEHEALEVRLAAVKALAALCDAASADELTKHARRAALPLATDEETQLGLAAADALGRIHPPDLATRLAPLGAADARPEARVAAARAGTGGTCR